MHDRLPRTASGILRQWFLVHSGRCSFWNSLLAAIAIKMQVTAVWDRTHEATASAHCPSRAEAIGAHLARVYAVL